MTDAVEFLARLRLAPAVLVTVQAHRGSVPRQAGAWMAVFADHTLGSVGGGHLEWQAIAQARERLGGRAGESVVRYALGPALGQCCGGEVHLQYELLHAADEAALRERFARARRCWPAVAVFGGGHVGQALVRVLASLPLRLHWIDSRDGVFSPDLATQVACEVSDPIDAAVPDLPAQSAVLIMSHSHVQDQAIVMACLTRQRKLADLAFMGLIGSQTKWATFSHRLAARGFTDVELAQVTCPIGLPGIVGREPEVIAVSVAAQVLRVLPPAQADCF